MTYEPNRNRGPGFGALLALVIVVGAGIIGYQTFKDRTANTADNASTIEHPVTSPKDFNASPVHPVPSPNPGP